MATLGRGCYKSLIRHSWNFGNWQLHRKAMFLIGPDTKHLEKLWTPNWYDLFRHYAPLKFISISQIFSFLNITKRYLFIEVAHSQEKYYRRYSVQIGLKSYMFLFLFLFITPEVLQSWRTSKISSLCMHPNATHMNPLCTEPGTCLQLLTTINMWTEAYA